MGWWWNSSSSQKDYTQPPTSDPTPSIPQPESEPSKPSLPSTRDERADAELREFLASLEWTDESNNSTPESTQTASSSHTNANSSPKSISPDSLYADTMSCRSAFDYAFFCQSFGGQWVNVYRYGELRSCSEHWENFWLCMKTRSYPDNVRKEIIRNHNRKKAVKYKTGPSSEDVWDLRTEPLVDAFKGDFEVFEKELKEEQAMGQR
ncbi:hypothetical protein BGW36DRAFT_370964 [Talaromyces proteolyticus]|uniref:Early meiotic induction protein 1 n=1 Tax=Talaromyces proteolyticus TaxID=1131652 RepID=A0AAD4Q321_9EURO|nr:uncharacterized protein BGW36DRAFT_370964 [Talaromyces proteolyticus]KAH8704252.1 hypothetical protein BGW36DRAFT_370964 [Talaromyces proteolyticus]